VSSAKKRSIDSAVGYAKENNLFDDMVTSRTFYNWIDDGLLKIKNIDLILKVRRKLKSKLKDRKKKLGRSIEERPAETETREESGHWEGDGIIGKNRKGHIITFLSSTFDYSILSIQVKSKPLPAAVAVSA